MNLNDSETKLIKAKTLANRYSVSLRQIQLWTKTGVLPVYKLGRRCVRYSIDECDEVMNNYKNL